VRMIRPFGALRLCRSLFVFLRVRAVSIHQMEHSRHLHLTCLGCRHPSRTQCFVRCTPNREH
jgi:hypothetical protein